METQAKTLARQRIDSSPKLKLWADFLIAPAPSGDEWYQYVATADEDVLLEWVGNHVSFAMITAAWEDGD